MRYILFDIDGTLTADGDGGGAGSAALNFACRDLFGKENGFDAIKKAGKTDLIILKEGFALHGVPYTPENAKAFRDRYLHYLKQFVSAEGKRARRLPGAVEILEALRGRNDAAFGLLTGNWSDGARIKLGSVGLADYFFSNGSQPMGAFGEDAPTRPELVPVAWQRFRERYRADIAPGDTVIVGDTPRDIEAAKLNGARAIGVTTGPYSRTELASAGADVILDGIADTQAVLAHLLDATG